MPPVMRVRTLTQVPHLLPAVIENNDSIWPEFVNSTLAGIHFWDPLYDELSDYQLVVTDENDTLMACGHTVPFWWDGTKEGLPVGWDDMITQGVLRHRAGRPCNTLGMLSISVEPAFRGMNIGKILAQAAGTNAAHAGYKQAVVPLRPVKKHLHPEVDMEEYMTWTDEKGNAYDPWIRTHQSVGAEIIKAASHSMVTRGTLEEWKQWLGYPFPAGASTYVVESGLVPVKINWEENTALYEEPNVWLQHQVKKTQPAANIRFEFLH